MPTTHEIVQKLWNQCHVLRDAGVSYLQYVTELTYLLFLKMMKETGGGEQIPKGYRWDDLTRMEGIEQLDFYRKLLVDLGGKGSRRVQAIFANATTAIRQPRHLAIIVEAVDSLDWYSAKHEGLGDLYEGLLEKNAEEVKSGAGQYFTPRSLIESMVELTQPKPGERIQDPAVGTGGFLINADRYIKGKTDDLHDLSTSQQNFQRREAFYGVELVADVQRLALMNAMLHDIEGEIILGDTLGPTGASLPKADLILTNPPFGTKKGGGGATRDDITYPTSNKQLVFLQHIYRGLKTGGRAAVVLPDNVLFEEGTGQKVRADLMDKCDLHTILRLPTGIFYAQGVKTNVLFFARGARDKDNTKAVWVFDMRTNMPSFGKRTPFARAHFEEFEKAFGPDPLGTSKRKDGGVEGRFRRFTREEIRKRGDNLDIQWLKDESVTDHADLPEPDEIALEIVARLQTSLEAMQGLHEELGSLTAGWRADHKDVEPANEFLARIRAARRTRWEEAEFAKQEAKGKAPTDDKWKSKYKEPLPLETADLPKLPDGWCWASLDELTIVVGGITKGQARKGTEKLRSVPYLRVANVQRGHLDLEELKTIEATEAEIADLLLHPGDVLLNEGGDRDKLGRGWVWEGQLPECIHQNHVFRARPVLADLQPKYLSHYANQMGQAFFVDQGKQTTNLASISMSRVRRFPVALPPAAEQAALVEIITERLAEVAAISHTTLTLTEQLAVFERAFLAKAFRGEFMPRGKCERRRAKDT